MKKEVERFRAQAVDRAAKSLVERAETVNGVHVVKAVLPVDPALAKGYCFQGCVKHYQRTWFVY